MRILKEVFTFVFTIGFLAFAAFGLWVSIHGIGSGSILITVPNGRTTDTYRTDTIYYDNGRCVEFKLWKGRKQVCGNYSVLR